MYTVHVLYSQWPFSCNILIWRKCDFNCPELQVAFPVAKEKEREKKKI